MVRKKEIVGAIKAGQERTFALSLYQTFSPTNHVLHNGTLITVHHNCVVVRQTPEEKARGGGRNVYYGVWMAMVAVPDGGI